MWAAPPTDSQTVTDPLHHVVSGNPPCPAVRQTAPYSQLIALPFCTFSLSSSAPMSHTQMMQAARWEAEQPKHEFSLSLSVFFFLLWDGVIFHSCQAPNAKCQPLMLTNVRATWPGKGRTKVSEFSWTLNLADYAQWRDAVEIRLFIFSHVGSSFVCKASMQTS